MIGFRLGSNEEKFLLDWDLGKDGEVVEGLAGAQGGIEVEAVRG